MQLARFARTLGLLLAVGLAGFGGGGGCSPQSHEMSAEESQQTKAYHKGVHQQLKEEAKNLKKALGSSRRGAHGGR